MAGRRMEDILRLLTDDEREAVVRHLMGETSANWLSNALTVHVGPISATTIKEYRRSLREQAA